MQQSICLSTLCILVTQLTFLRQAKSQHHSASGVFDHSLAQTPPVASASTDCWEHPVPAGFYDIVLVL